MEVILLEKVDQLGALGDTVKVTPGYARNFLIPTRKAIPATEANRNRIEAQRAELLRTQSTSLGEAERRAALLADYTVSIRSRAGTEGRLFGSVGTVDIADALSAGGIPVEKREVRLPTGPLRELGEHAVQVHLHPDVNVTIKVLVVADEGAAAP